MAPLYIVLILFCYTKPSETNHRDEIKNGVNIKNIDFVKEKLIQHNQALEYIVSIIENSEQMLKKIVELLSTKLEQPPMPEKIENRRSFMGRYMDGSDVVTTEAVDVESSIWCPVALMCVKDSKPVCAFDDNFGHAKFIDTCHMLHVNCYWKYNFVLSSRCGQNHNFQKNN